MKNQTAKWIGRILLILSFLFIGYKVYQHDMQWNLLLNTRILIIVVMAVLIHGLNNFIATFSYGDIVKIIIEKELEQSVITNIYCKSDLYKYLPGNIMHYIGRNQIAIILSVSHVDIGMATIFEMFCLILSGMLITMMCSYQYFLDYLKLFDLQVSVIIVFFICIICLVVALYVYKSKLCRAIDKYKKLLCKKNAKKVMGIFIKSAIRLLINAIVFIILMYFFDMRIDDIYVFVMIIGIFVMSWLIGFVTPGASGGLGVREFIMTVFLSPFFQENILLLVLLVYRVICILGDMMGYVYAMIWSAVCNDRQ